MRAPVAAAAPNQMSIEQWTCRQVVDALHAHGAEPLPERVLSSATAWVERHKLDGADVADACSDDLVLAQWLPAVAYATDQRVRKSGYRDYALCGCVVWARPDLIAFQCTLSSFFPTEIERSLAENDCQRCCQRRARFVNLHRGSCQH